MPSLVKSLVLGAAVAAATLASLPQAQAGDGWRHRHHRHGNGGELLAAGIVGLTVGALIAAANEPPAYRDPIYLREPPARPRPDRDWYPVAPPQPYAGYDDGYPSGYAATAEPWSAAWYDWCEARYRTFDPQTGTYRGYDGRDHFCVAP